MCSFVGAAVILAAPQGTFGRSAMMKQLFMICAAVMLLVSVPASAAVVTYTVGGWLGAPPTYQGPKWYGDTLEMISYSGTLDLTPGMYTQKINTFDWVIDATSDWAVYFDVTAGPRGMSFDGGASQDVSQTGLLSCLPDNDYVTINAGPMVSFIVQGYQVDVTPLGFSRSGAGPFNGLPWPQAESDVMAQFVVTAVPEPMTLGLLGLGGLLLRRRMA
jgi:hypothetical protein